MYSPNMLLYSIQTKEATEVAQILEILFENGIKPKILLSDNGSEFKNTIVKETCQRYQVYQITNFPYTPLGIIERFNKTIKNIIFAFMNTKTMSYIDVLQLLVQNYNHTIHSTIKQKPIGHENYSTFMSPYFFSVQFHADPKDLCYPLENGMIEFLFGTESLGG